MYIIELFIRPVEVSPWPSVTFFCITNLLSQHNKIEHLILIQKWKKNKKKQTSSSSHICRPIVVIPLQSRSVTTLTSLFSAIIVQVSKVIDDLILR